VVIGDRLFSQPIQVEGFKVNDIHASEMAVDDGNSSARHNIEGREDGRSDSNASQNIEGREDGRSDSNASQGKGKNSDSSSPSQLNDTSTNARQVDDLREGEKNMEGVHVVVPKQGEVNNAHKVGNSMNLN
jgi:hypothetical protein